MMDIELVSRKLGWLSSKLAYVGAVALFGMMCLTAADVIGRYVFNRPITGVFELTEYLVLILIFSFIGYTQSQKGHVAVDLLLAKFPRGIRTIVEICNHFICLMLMGLITWMGVQKALDLKDVGEASPNLQIPAYPFVFFLVLGCAVMCIELLRDILKLFPAGKQGDES
jgi:TRAP-type C4-dicarboxylate transport system permease small subunit